MNKAFAALILSFLTGGWIDYSPGCNRPWAIGGIGRGRTLLTAFNRKDDRY